MCGFVGIIEKYPLDFNNSQTDIEIMLEKIKHRGPDGDKITNYLKTYYFGFVRLAMLDNDNSNQPIINEKGNLILFFNGEIYNYIQIRNRLIEKGHVFKTDGDGETILHLYEEHNEKCLEYLDGMYSFCIIDTETKKVFAARDSHGIKPLYYCDDGNRFLIASELKAILAVQNSTRTISKKSLELFVNLRFVPSPYTIYEKIRKLQAGEYLSINKMQLEVRRHHYFNAEYLDFSIENLENVFVQDVVSTYTSNVELGVFLSGGLDSSLISSILKHKKSDILKAYSVGYDVKAQCDETEVAKIIAKEIGIQHYVEKIDNNELKGLLEKAIYHLEEPFYSSVSVSTLKLSQMASKYVKGIFSGDGSDELFFGYKYLRDSLMENSLSDIRRKYVSGLSWLKNVNTEHLLDGAELNEDDLNHIIFDGCEMKDFAETLRRVEVYKRLPDYHLTRVDKITMACGLEGRVPFLRRATVSAALGMDCMTLLNNSDPKKALKTQLNRYLTSEMRKSIKQPFTSPIKEWMEGPLKEDMEDLFNDSNLLEKCFLKRKFVNEILASYNGLPWQVSNLWGIYTLLKWARITKL